MSNIKTQAEQIEAYIAQKEATLERKKVQFKESIAAEEKEIEKIRTDITSKISEMLQLCGITPTNSDDRTSPKPLLPKNVSQRGKVIVNKSSVEMGVLNTLIILAEKSPADDYGLSISDVERFMKEGAHEISRYGNRLRMQKFAKLEYIKPVNKNSEAGKRAINLRFVLTEKGKQKLDELRKKYSQFEM